MGKRILFVAPFPPGTAPSQRFRFEQYLAHLRAEGFETELSCLLSPEALAIYREPGFLLRKLRIVAAALLRRVQDVFRANRFDIIFIHREAFMVGPPVFERLFCLSRAKTVFDFDDSIWMENVTEAVKRLGWLKCPQKIPRILSMVDHVIAGNSYLAEYARNHNPAVTVLPTTIDTDEYQPCQRGDSDSNAPVCVGWSGSFSTIKHFSLVLPVLRDLKARLGSKVRFKVIGDPKFEDAELGIQGIGWKKETELRDLADFDIGIMPLPADEWAKGKCGLKGLQYMALGIPAVMSPVGVNSEIVSDDENGLLARDSDEWFGKLLRLVESPELRERLGTAGRSTVMQRYSLSSQKSNLSGLLNRLVKRSELGEALSRNTPLGFRE